MLQAGLLLLAWPVAAQLRFGEVSSSANGTLSTGYTAGYGNMEGSNHGWTVGGEGAFSGSFHSPNFLTFNASVYLNQSREALKNVPQGGSVWTFALFPQ